MPPSRIDPPSTHHGLLDDLRTHCRTAWEAFFHRYGPVIRNWCARHRLPPETCDDIAQDLILSLPSKLRSYQREADDGGPNRFRCWLRMVVRHAVVDYLRARAHKGADFGVGGADEFLRQVPLRELEGDLSDSHRADVESVLLAVRAKVEPDTWDVYQEVQLHGVAVCDAADRFGKSLGAVYALIHRVNGFLQDEYQRLITGSDRPDEVAPHAAVPDPQHPPPGACQHVI